jgi:hypothetical protein
VAGSCEYGDEPSGYGATELVNSNDSKNVPFAYNPEMLPLS